MNETLRPVAIVLNVLLLGMIGFQINKNGLPAEEGQLLLVLLVILAPVASLAAIWRGR